MDKPVFHYPDALVTGEWLEAYINDPALRVFDCTSHLVSAEGTGRLYRAISGRSDYQTGHIPGSGFLDLVEDFSDKESPYLHTVPSAQKTADAFARHGVSDGTRVVLYSRKSMQRATRFWWMLRWLGFDNVSILDGGYDKWVTDRRTISTEPCEYPAGQISIKLRPELFVDKDAMLAATRDPRTSLINALEPDQHSGVDPRYGRPGHIPGSSNVPAAALLNPDTLEIVSPETAMKTFSAAGIDPSKRIFTYCGGGIAATMVAFVLHQLGFRDIAVYDNSMSEWAMDTTLPIETD